MPVGAGVEALRLVPDQQRLAVVGGEGVDLHRLQTLPDEVEGLGVDRRAEDGTGATRRQGAAELLVVVGVLAGERGDPLARALAAQRVVRVVPARRADQRDAPGVVPGEHAEDPGEDLGEFGSGAVADGESDDGWHGGVPFPLLWRPGQTAAVSTRWSPGMPALSGA